MSAARMPFPPAKYANVAARSAPPQPTVDPSVRRETQQREDAAATRRKHKADQADRVLTRLEERQAARCGVIKQLQRQNALDAARHEKIEDRILSEMTAAGFDRFYGFHRTLSTQDCPPAVQIESVDQIPAQYMRTIPASSAPDKVAIKDALKKKVEVPGAYLTSKVSLKRI